MKTLVSLTDNSLDNPRIKECSCGRRLSSWHKEKGIKYCPHCEQVIFNQRGR